MISFLTSLGFSDNEAKVYLALLALGNSAVFTIAKKAGINRGTTYTILSDLVQKGFAYEGYRSNVRYYSALAPEDLLSVFQKRVSKMENLLPELQALDANASSSLRVRYFNGFEEVKHMYFEEFQDTTSDLCVFKAGVERRGDKKKLEALRKELKKTVLPKRKVQIIGASASSTAESDKKKGTERKSLPKSEMLLPASVKIYGNKVHFISLRNRLFGVEIENEDIAQCLREIFHTLWKRI